ncbi:MAG: glycosyltransferase [Acidimicrobiales bacterium]
MEAPAVTLLEGRPLVTLVVPCHGEGRYLDDCLRSLRGQHYRWLEIIVIDDAGHDDSAAVAAEHALADPRVVVVRLRRNVGLGAVRNYGLRAARGELIGFVDGDDLLPARSVSARVQTLADHLRDPAFASVPIAGVYGDWDYVAPAVDEHVPAGGSRDLVAIDLAASAGGNVFIVSAPLVRTDVLRTTGGFAEAVTGGEDHIAWMRVLATGAVFVPCSEVVARYRQKPISMVRTSVAEYAALTAASRRQLPHDTMHPDPAGPVELVELAAGEHTISFGVVEDQRPTMAARAPAAVATAHSPAGPAPDAHPPAGRDPQVPTPAAVPWPDTPPAGPRFRERPRRSARRCWRVPKHRSGPMPTSLSAEPASWRCSLDQAMPTARSLAPRPLSPTPTPTPTPTSTQRRSRSGPRPLPVASPRWLRR